MTNGAIHSKTPNYGLNKVNFDFPRWHSYEWDNWDVVDAGLRSLGATPTDGVWQNSTEYGVGTRVVDPDTGVAYNNLIAHTSLPIGSFADERVAHPEWWAPVTGVPHFSGQWQNAKQYYTGDIAFENYVYRICIQTHVSTPGSFVDGPYWSSIFDASTATVAITVSDSPPPVPLVNTLWWDSDQAVLYLRYNDGNSVQWVDIMAAGMTAGGAFVGPNTDGFVYGSKGNDGWVKVTEEAPTNGSQYVRRNAAWQIITSPFDVLPAGSKTWGYSAVGGWKEVLPITGGTLTGALSINGTLTAKATTVDSINALAGGTMGGGLVVNGGDIWASAGHITCSKTMQAGQNAVFNGARAADYGVIGYAGSGYGGVRGFSNNNAAWGILGHVDTYALYGQGQAYTTGFAQFNVGRTANYGVYGYAGSGYGGVIGYSNNNVIYGILGYNNTYSFYGIGELLNTGHMINHSYAEFNTARVASAHGVYAYGANATAALYAQSGNQAVYTLLANDNLYSMYGVGQIHNAGAVRFTDSLRVDGQCVFINVRDVVSSGGRYVKINTSAGNVFSSTTYQDEHCFDVEPMEDEYADKVLQLEPKFLRVDYEMDRPDWSKFGFLDNHTREVDVRFVAGHEDAEGEFVPDDIDVQAILAALVNVVKRQDARIKALEEALHGV